MSLTHENGIIEQTPILLDEIDYQESARKGFDGRLAVIVAGTLSLAACGAAAEGANSNTERPEPVITTVDVPTTPLDAPVVVTTEIPKPETTVATSKEFRARREPGIIKPIDVEGLTADLTSEINQEAFEDMLAAASEVVTYGYNNNSMEHLKLTTGHPVAIENVTRILNDINHIKETQISGYKFGYRMEARGTYRIEADGSIIADVEEFENNRGAIRSEDWVSVGVYTMHFRQVATNVQVPDGTTESVPVWTFAGTLSR